MNKLPYTIITGASEGFGKALALECASRGRNLILVALPGSGLKNLAGFIEEMFGVRVCFFEKDLSNEAECYALHDEVVRLSFSVDILINNAGLGSTEWFRNSSPSFFEKQIRLNISATTLLTRLFLEILLQHQQSYILNVGSLSCYFFLPKKTVYGSTKSYIYYFSKALGNELKNDGVNVSLVCPGGMNTNSTITFQNRCSSWFSRNSAMNPEQVARIAIDGMLAGQRVIIPGRMNRLFRLVDYLLPERIKSFISMKQMENQKLPVFMSAFQPAKTRELPAA